MNGKTTPGSEAPPKSATLVRSNGGEKATPPALSSNVDDWEIDNSQLKLISKIANGSFGEL